MTGTSALRPRRVAFLIGDLNPGGTQKQLILLTRELRQAGVEVHVLLLTRGGPFEPALREAGANVHLLGFGRGTGAGNLRALARLVRLLRILRPEVLHAFLHHCCVIGVPAARLARVPVVVAGRRNEVRLDLTHPWSLPLEKVTARMTHHVVVNAKVLARDTEGIGVPPGRISVIYNGLSADAFAPAEPAPVDTALPVLLCVARLSAEKGHRSLLEAQALLARRGRPCTLLLAGDGPERERLEKQAAMLGVDVRFLGFRMDGAGLLARADVVVLPSTTEGLSNAVMEAMAAGRPVVATAVGGNPELLEGRGVLVPPADPAALADGVARLLDDPELARRTAAEARLWAREHLDPRVLRDEHLTLYHRLLKARDGR
ncbi:glycosyltransferase [Nonomuraea roseoviolacea]|uniref:Glycosyltransferase involved in cell wall biosynthesis n=1 Tax=Nonomuraea roseoviolacea subsp. carminata TaxID=160689 RepID=A0ABT1K5K1_9ACTN|nr:glycosyltransferase [Nonomuraea roseoviolacea]MCP2349165.1 glycosyltransferase involved in cell wall biosynthesis [Nonomuraea roseoviolacea subsp. carminata]